MLARRTSFISLIYESSNDPEAYAVFIERGIIGGTGSMTAHIYRSSAASTPTTIADDARWEFSTDDGDTYSTVSADTNHVFGYGAFTAVEGTSWYKSIVTLTIGGSSGIVVGDYGLYRLRATGTDDPDYTRTFDFSDPS
jgi:hypothetical protein